MSQNQPSLSHDHRQDPAGPPIFMQELANLNSSGLDELAALGQEPGFLNQAGFSVTVADQLEDYHIQTPTGTTFYQFHGNEASHPPTTGSALESQLTYRPAPQNDAYWRDQPVTHQASSPRLSRFPQLLTANFLNLPNLDTAGQQHAVSIADHIYDYASPSDGVHPESATSSHLSTLKEDETQDSSLVFVGEDKRRRNLAASARFRQKKKLKEQQLEIHNRELFEKAENLELRISDLEAENRFLKGLLTEKDTGATPSKTARLAAKIQGDVGTAQV